MLPEREILYKALVARDKRYDGRFYVGVRTTRIYCRPTCPARPLLKNVEFYRSPAEAEGLGFRPCLRCRPDLSPSSPLFAGTAAVVGRALRLIAEGGADSDSLERLAGRLGITGRHLRRLFAEHVGAAPVAVAASKRLHLARLLLSQTRLPVTEIAFAAGFRSLRRFNATFLEKYRRSPREFRRENVPGGELTLELPYLPPYDWAALAAFLGRHALPGVETCTAEAWERRLPGGGSVRVTPGKGCLRVTFAGVPVGELRAHLEGVRRVFDLDHNPAQLPRALGGVRIPGAFDPFETAVSVILGQLVSTAAARTLAGRLVERFGKFPCPEELAEHRLPGLPRTKASAIRELARLVRSGKLALSRSAPLEETRERLAAIHGVGPWTVEVIALRCLGDPDAFPAKDLVVARALQSGLAQPELWRPWRGYLTLWLWKTHSGEKI